MTLYFDRLRSLLRGQVPRDRLVERLPYLGVDLEEVGPDSVRVEYNPNRPDLSTDYGIARALNGLFGFELGTPHYRIAPARLTVNVDPSVRGVRPYIVAAVVCKVRLDEETIRQVISMQEDLHAGIGRHRRRVAIGLHNLDVIQPPIRYGTVPSTFRFQPLGEARPMSIREILTRTETGRDYGPIVAGGGRFPILTDKSGDVLSLPPIVNAERTRVSGSTRNLFLDLTATDLSAAEQALHILCTSLHDAGGQLEAVHIHQPEGDIDTPRLVERRAPVDLQLVHRLLGLELTPTEVAACLARSRFSTKQDGGGLMASIPSYRFDILHPVDLVEEVAIGYGLDRFTFTLPQGSSVGVYDKTLRELDRVRSAMVGLGLVEVMNFTLVSRTTLGPATSRRGVQLLRVQNPKTLEHEVLRDALFPSLLSVLARNVHEDYPQRIFEIGKVFLRDSRQDTGIREEFHVGAVLAHASASYSEARSVLAALVHQAFARIVRTPSTRHPSFVPGRVARVLVDGEPRGVAGEVHPKVLTNFDLRTPVAAFELNLTGVHPKPGPAKA